MRQAICYAGTSGGSYPHWAKGRFYPCGMKQRDWLRFYADHFSTVEVNTTFYRLPGATLVKRWCDTAPDHFIFTIKLWRRITHDKRLIDCREELRRPADAVSVLSEKRGPMLIQLPPSMPCDPELLDRFFDKSHEVRAVVPWRFAVEFRRSEWLCDTVRDVLDRHLVALCLTDMPQCLVTEPNDTPFVYIRRHGPAGRYRGRYTDDHIASDAARIRQWLDQGRDVCVYFNNDLEGHAVDNARQLLHAVR